MPIPLPNLDDLTFEELLEQARTTIPAFAPEWTNFNASDPGITLIELFAFWTCSFVVKTNELQDAELLSFLKLLTGPDARPQPGTSLHEQLSVAIRALRSPTRAVSRADFEALSLTSDSRIARVCCLPNVNVSGRNTGLAYEHRPGHTSVIVLPSSQAVSQTTDILHQLTAYLEPRRLITSKVHVSAARHLPVAVQLRIVSGGGIQQSLLRERVLADITNFFDPWTGGPAGTGWPFGRAAFVSSLYERISTIEGVDYVTRLSDFRGAPRPELVALEDDVQRAQLNARGELSGIHLRADELVAFQPERSTIAVSFG